MIPYIIKALQQKESVCVNDLGTFSVHYVPARISGKEILAPHNDVTLDTNIDHDEIAFTNFVGMEKKCLLTQANQEITNWVENLQTALANNKSITYDGFGTFALSDKGKVSFTCEHIPELNEEFEGMGAIVVGAPITIETTDNSNLEEEQQPAEAVAEPTPEPIPEEEPVIYRSTILEDEQQPAEVVAEPTPEPIPEEEPVIYRSTILEEEQTSTDNVSTAETSTEAIEPTEVAEPITKDVEDIEEAENEDNTESIESDGEDEISSNNANKKSHKWIWILIVLLLLGAIAACGYLFKDKITPVYEQLKSKIAKTEETVEPKNEESSNEESSIEEPVEEETIEETAPYSPEIIKSSADGKYQYIHFENGHYYVIAGSLPNEADAELHIRQRGLDKYEPKLLLQDGVGNIRVCIGIYDTEEEAENYAKSISPKYWVLK